MVLFLILQQSFSHIVEMLQLQEQRFISGDLGFLHLAPFVQNQQSIRYLDYVVSR